MPVGDGKGGALRQPLISEDEDMRQLRMPSTDPSMVRWKEPEAERVAVGTQQVLLEYHLSSLRTKSTANYIIAILCLTYIGVNLTCLVINSLSEEKREEFELPFHLLEFWATFLFAVLEVCALAVSPQPITSVYGNPLLLKAVMFANVTVSFVPAALVTFSLETFEIPAHQVEYSNEITMSFVDLVLLFSILKSKDALGAKDFFLDSSTIMVGLASIIAIVQLSIYNFIKGEDGEQIAHFFEFIFEMISAGITFWFAVDSKIMCDRKIANIFRNPMAEYSWQLDARDYFRDSVVE
uniref:Uncharacterized protein n=1 Tax=Phaeomonas parva TaxID=124430 RepID=A0A7S1XWR6_9STRA